MFLVLKGTPCQVTHFEKKLGPVEHVTRKDNLFDKHEVVFDPLFNLAPSLGDLYGFQCEETGYTLFVSQKHIKFCD
tara:strand:- start:189 stop:416 length:228 start_codon:yes stop_codon:yes gene_type:complete